MMLTQADKRFTIAILLSGLFALSPWVYILSGAPLHVEPIMTVQRITTMEDETFDSILFSGTESECEQFIANERKAGNITCFDVVVIVP